MLWGCPLPQPHNHSPLNHDDLDTSGRKIADHGPFLSRSSGVGRVVKRLVCFGREARQPWPSLWSWRGCWVAGFRVVKRWGRVAIPPGPERASRLPGLPAETNPSPHHLPGHQAAWASGGLRRFPSASAARRGSLTRPSGKGGVVGWRVFGGEAPSHGHRSAGGEALRKADHPSETRADLKAAAPRGRSRRGLSVWRRAVHSLGKSLARCRGRCRTLGA